MRDLMEYAQKAMTILDDMEIKYGNIASFTVNTRAKKRWGLCTETPSGYVIAIASCLLDERNDESGLMNTLLHELLHSVPDCMNHGALWQCLAARVYKEHGYNIKRTSSAEEKGIVYKEEIVRKPKYKFICQNCGQTIIRYRECDFTLRYNKYRCGICKGKFERAL